MTKSVRTANDIRLYVYELVERLYKTDETIELVKKVELQLIIDELVRLSTEIVLSTVADAVSLENI
jgi:hypothetical protein